MPLPHSARLITHSCWSAFKWRNKHKFGGSRICHARGPVSSKHQPDTIKSSQPVFESDHHPLFWTKIMLKIFCSKSILKVTIQMSYSFILSFIHSTMAAPLRVQPWLFVSWTIYLKNNLIYSINIFENYLHYLGLCCHLCCHSLCVKKPKPLTIQFSHYLF